MALNCAAVFGDTRNADVGFFQVVFSFPESRLVRDQRQAHHLIRQRKRTGTPCACALVIQGVTLGTKARVGQLRLWLSVETRAGRGFAGLPQRLLPERDFPPRTPEPGPF